MLKSKQSFVNTVILEMFQVIESTAFFSMAFSGTMSDVSFPLTLQSYASVLTMVVSCTYGVAFLVFFVGIQ